MRFLPIDGVKGDPKQYWHRIVKRVELKLHPTFRKPHERNLEFKPGEDEASFKTVAWGWFEIPITIYFQPALKIKPVTFEHTLNFSGAGKWRNVESQISVKKFA